MDKVKNISGTAFVFLIVFALISGCKTGRGQKQNADEQAVAAVAEPYPGMSIHEAAVNGHTAQVISLLDAGMSTDTLDIEGRTALMYASYNGYTPIVKKLLEKGANVNLQDKYGRTALMMASSGPYSETVKLLLEKYADPNIVDTEEHFSALMYAASEGQMENVKLLLASKADPSFKDVDGDDAMSFAKSNGHAEVFVLLQSLRK
jgi:ankyrin repeat protein